MKALTFEACQPGKPIKKEFDGQQVYIRVMTGMQAVRYQDEVAADSDQSDGSDSLRGLRYAARLVKHFIVDKNNNPLCGHLSVDEIIEQAGSDYIYGLGALVHDERVGPESVEEAEKN